MPTNPALRGARRARHAVHDHLKARLNKRIQALGALDDEAQLVPIGEWHPHWVPSSQVQKWPVLMVTSHHGTVGERLDWVDGDPVYQWSWVIRVWVWARGDSYEQTCDRVEAIAMCIADELLGRPGLADPDDGVKVAPGPLTVSLSDIEKDPRMRASIAGAFVEAVVTMAETATADPPQWDGDGDPISFDLDVEPKDPTA